MPGQVLNKDFRIILFYDEGKVVLKEDTRDAKLITTNDYKKLL